MRSTFVVAPPPPPPPPMAAVKVKQMKLAQVIKTNPVTPTFIPKKIEVEKDQAAAPNVAQALRTTEFRAAPVMCSEESEATDPLCRLRRSRRPRSESPWAGK